MRRAPIAGDAADLNRAPLRLEELTAIRGTPLFQPLTLQLEPGTLLAVVGPNGAGKSSLLGAIAGVGVPHTGRALLGSQQISKLRGPRRAAALSFMTQDSTAPNELRVLDVVRIGAQAAVGTQRTTATSIAMDALKRMDIAGLAGRVCSTLSGGQRQLVQVARVLAQSAPVMLFDEPTSALDLGHQLTVMHALTASAHAGHIVIISMHDLTQALRWSNSIALVANGMVTVGPPAEVITTDLVRGAYGVETEVFASPTGSPTLSLVRPKGLDPIFSSAPQQGFRTTPSTSERPS